MPPTFIIITPNLNLPRFLTLAYGEPECLTFCFLAQSVGYRQMKYFHHNLSQKER